MKLDRDRKYGQIFGLGPARFEQDGMLFDAGGFLIPTADEPPEVAKAMERLSDLAESPAHEEAIHRIRKRLSKKHHNQISAMTERLARKKKEEEGLDFKPHKGAGSKEKNIELLIGFGFGQDQ